MENAKTILLVEDEALIALAEARDLKKEGYAVITAASGPEAIDAVRSDPGAIDLILMDIDLGRGMDGTEAALTILQNHDIPVIFLTSHTEKEIIDKAEKITSHGFVVKNTGITMLAASIRMAFRLHEANRHIIEKNREIESSNKKLVAAVEKLTLSQKELQEKSDEIEKRYVLLRMAQSAGRIGSYDLNLETSEGHWSDVYSEIMGVPNREAPWTLEEWQSFIVPEDLPQVMADFESAIREGENTSIAYRIRRPDSEEIRWLEARGKVIYGRDRTPLRMIGIVIDVTDRKKAEEALKESEDTYRLLFNNVPVGIGISDAQGISIDCNRVFEEIIGSPISEMRGHDVGFAYRDPSERDEIRAILKKEGRVRDREIYFRRKDGTDYCALLNIDSMMLHGRPVNLVTVRDITEWKHTEDLLRESETRYRALVENSQIGIGVADGLSDRILYANSALLKMYGYDSFEEHSARPLTDYLTMDSRRSEERRVGKEC